MSGREESREKFGNRKMVSRRKRIAEEQVIHKVHLEMEPSVRTRKLEDIISLIYGIPGIGKSRFAMEMGIALQERYGLTIPGAYLIQCEPVNHSWKSRGTKDAAGNDFWMKTWPTFRSFVDNVEKNKEFLRTVKLWIVDTVDNAIPKAISSICSDYGIVDPSDEGWSNAWKELQDEFEYQILRLRQMGPGVLMLSHERDVEIQRDNMKFDQARPDLSPGMFNRIGDLCSVILRMRDNDRKKGDRCLVAQEGRHEFAKDNLNAIIGKYPKGVIPFGTEAELAVKLLDCFGTTRATKKKVGKKKTKKTLRK